jgi:hypothetical protein
LALGGVDNAQGRQYEIAPNGRFLINTVLDNSATTPITLLTNWNPGRRRSPRTDKSSYVAQGLLKRRLCHQRKASTPPTCGFVGALRSCGARDNHPSNRMREDTRLRWGGTPQGTRLWDTLQLWQSDNSESPISAPTPSSAPNNASFRSQMKRVLSSRRSLNSVLLDEDSGLRGCLTAPSPLVGKAVQMEQASSGVVAERCRLRRGSGSAKLRRRGGRSRSERRSDLR